MANQYPTSSTAVTTDWAGNRSTTATTFTYASPVVAKTADYTVLASDSGTVFTNGGASAQVTFTLPAVQAGLSFRFACTAGFNLLITGATTSIKGAAGAASGTPAAISATTLTIAGGTATSLYTVVSLECDGTRWLISNIQGQVTAS